MSENGEIYTACKNVTLAQALTAWTNSTSGLTEAEGGLRGLRGAEGGSGVRGVWNLVSFQKI